MNPLLQANWNRSRKVLTLVVSIALCSGCASQLNQPAFGKSAPRRVGLVIGHDIKAVSSMTTQEEALVAISFGLIGVAVLEATAKDWSLGFAQQMNDMLRERVAGQMKAKGFRVRLLRSTPTKWSLFENISDTADAYARLAEKHHLGSRVDEVDSILFVEYLLEGRLEGRFIETSQLADLTIRNMKPRYAKCKVWLYDTKTGTRLFHKMVQKGYPSHTGTSITEALDALIDLDSIPPAASHRPGP